MKNINKEPRLNRLCLVSNYWWLNSLPWSTRKRYFHNSGYQIPNLATSFSVGTSHLATRPLKVLLLLLLPDIRPGLIRAYKGLLPKILRVLVVTVALVFLKTLFTHLRILKVRR